MKYLLPFMLMVSLMMAKHQPDSQNAFQIDSQMSFRNDTTSIKFYDFEGTLEWTSLDLTMASGMWHVDDFDTPDGTGMAWWMGDTVINGYLDHTYLILDTPEILVPQGGHLTFDLNYNVEGTAGAETPYNGWDGSNVRISTNGGASWSVLLARQVTTVLLFIVLVLHMAKVRILRVGAAVVMDGSVPILIFHPTVVRL